MTAGRRGAVIQHPPGFLNLDASLQRDIHKDGGSAIIAPDAL
jgi:hypothetical protein